MKLQAMFVVLIFYNSLMHSEQNNPFEQSLAHYQYPQASSVQIIIHAETQSNSEQDNAIDQEAKHTPRLTTTVENSIEQKATQSDQEVGLAATIAYGYGTLLCPVCSLTYYILSKSLNKR